MHTGAWGQLHTLILPWRVSDVSNVKDLGTEGGRGNNKSQEQRSPLHISRTASWEGWGWCTEAPGATDSSRLPSFAPPAGHGRAGGRVPAGGEVSRPQHPMAPPGSCPPSSISEPGPPFCCLCLFRSLPWHSPQTPHCASESLGASKYCRCLGPTPTHPVLLTSVLLERSNILAKLNSPIFLTLGRIPAILVTGTCRGQAGTVRINSPKPWPRAEAVPSPHRQ